MLATAFRVGKRGLARSERIKLRETSRSRTTRTTPVSKYSQRPRTFRPSVTSLQFRHDKTHQLGALAQHVLPLEPGITLAFDKYLLTLQLKEEDLPSSAKSSKAICDGGAHLALTTALTTALHEAHGDAAA